MLLMGMVDLARLFVLEAIPSFPACWQTASYALVLRDGGHIVASRLQLFSTIRLHGGMLVEMPPASTQIPNLEAQNVAVWEVLGTLSHGQ